MSTGNYSIGRSLDFAKHITISADLAGGSENYVSRSVEMISGEPAGSWFEKKRDVARFVFPGDRRKYQRVVALLATEDFACLDCRIVTNVNGVRWMHIEHTIMRSAAGIPVRQETFVFDITASKELEAELVQQKNLLRSVIDNIPDLIYVKDLQSRHIVNNRANVELLGAASEAETLGRTVEDYFISDEADFLADDRRVMASGIPQINKEEVIVSKSGRTGVFLTTKVPLRDKDGVITGLVGVSRDVTEDRKNDKELKQMVSNLQAVFENTSDAITLIDLNDKIVFANDTALRSALGGWTAGENVFDKLPDERREIFRNYLNRVQTGDVVKYNVEYNTPAGESVWIDVSIAPVKTKGAVSGYCITAHDLTAIKQAEKTLRTREERFRMLVEHSVDIFSIIDRQQRFSYVSPNIKNILGYEPDAFLGMAVDDLVYPEDLAMIRSELADGEFQQGKHFTFTLRARHKDGNYLVLEGTSVNLFETEGVNGRISIYHNATDKKLKEREILELNKSLSDFQNAIYGSAIVSRSDKNGNITFVNDNFLSASGYTRGELLNQNHRVVSSGLHSQDFWREMWNTISAGKVWRNDVRNRAKDGSFYWVDTFIMPFVSEGGEVTEYLSIRNNITARKKSEEALAESRYFIEKAQETAHIGYWTLSLTDPETPITWSPETLNIFGLKADEFDGKYETFLTLVHPDDLEKVKFDAGAAPVDQDFRIRRSNGEIRWVQAKTETVSDEGNTPVRLFGILQDITARKSAEEVMREFNSRYEILSRATNDSVWDLDMLHDLIFWNHSIYDVFGYSENEIGHTGTWWFEKVHPDDQQWLRQEVGQAVMEGRNRWSLHYRFQCADGSYRSVYNRAYILYDDQHKPVRMIGSILDETKRILAEEQVKKLSLVASKTNHGILIKDRDLRIEWINEGFTKLTGYEMHEVIGKTIDFLYGPATDPFTLRKRSEKLARHEFSSEEMILYSRTGRECWTKVDTTPIFDESGVLKNFISIHADITSLKEFESSITSIARELASLIENANVPIFGIDAKGNINEWNQVASEVTGYDKSKVLGQPWLNRLTDPPAVPVIDKIVEDVMQGNPVKNKELPIVTSDKRRLMLLLNAAPRKNTSQEVTGVIFVAQNITELTDYRTNLEIKVAERTRELNEALAKEKMLVDMKSRFVSIASHEFRTPLSSIAIASGTIRMHGKKMPDDEMRAKLENIEKQVDHMTYMLDDVLLVEKAEAGKLVLVPNEIHLESFLGNLCSEVSNSKGGSHEVRLTSNLLFEKIITDEKLLRSIVINLLTNAIKFSPEASVVDMIISNDADHFDLTVKDYGVGIPQADLANLFEPFYRAGNVSHIQGTGLGLSIIKKALEKLRGTITVNSSPGEGTEIHIRLPQQP